MSNLYLTIIALILGVLIGRYMPRSKQTPNVDTKRLDHLQDNGFGVLYNSERKAWCTLDADSKPFAASTTLRLTIDRSVEKLNG